MQSGRATAHLQPAQPSAGRPLALTPTAAVKVRSARVAVRPLPSSLASRQSLAYWAESREGSPAAGRGPGGQRQGGGGGR